MIPGIVLAAGRSTRMGRPKALLPVDASDTFLSRVVATLRAASIDDVVVVLGHEAAAIAASLESHGADARVVVNAGYDAGQLSSLVAGLRAVDRPGVTAALVTLVDVPLVSAATVRRLLDRHRATRAPIVRPVSGARHGHPIVIDRALFDAVFAADPSVGLKPLVHAHASSAGDVEVDDEGAFRDIDTPEDYAAL
ncbi:MAG: nucleotidyltransferase family protein [Betaproteobacteria bacterium]